MDAHCQIRPLELSEIPKLLELYEHFDRPSSPLLSDTSMADIFRQLNQAGGRVLGAFRNAELVGSCTFHLCANFSWSGRPFAILENVIVSRDHRQQGIGRQILRAATEKAQAMNCYKVALMTGSDEPATHAFYRSAGFSGDKTGYQIRFIES